MAAQRLPTLTMAFPRDSGSGIRLYRQRQCDIVQPGNGRDGASPSGKTRPSSRRAALQHTPKRGDSNRTVTETLWSSG